jgi:hypothetical protein
LEVEKINTEKKKVDSPQANLLSSRRWKKEHEHVDQRYNCTSTTRKLKDEIHGHILYLAK